MQMVNPTGKNVLQSMLLMMNGEKWRKLGQLDIWEQKSCVLLFLPESQIFKQSDPNVLNIEDCSIFLLPVTVLAGDFIRRSRCS